MNRRVTLIGVALTVLLAGLYAGCSNPTENEDPPRPPISSTLIRDNVFVAGSGMNLTDVADTTYTYSYSGAVPEIAPGDVLIDGSEGGQIRLVNSVTVNGSTLTLQTADAALTDAIIRCSINDSFFVSLEPIGSGKAPQPGFISSQVNYTAPGVSVSSGGLNFSSVELMDETVRSKDVAANINVGSLNYEPNLALSFQIDGSYVWSFEAKLVGDLDFTGDLQVTASDSVTHAAAPALLHSITHRYVKMVDFVPVVFGITLEFFGGCELDLESDLNMQYNLSSTNELEAGVRHSSSTWYPVFESEVEAGAGQAQVNGYPEGNVRCYVKPVVTLALYSVPGMEIGIHPYLAYQSTSDGFVWEYSMMAGYDYELIASMPTLAHGLDAIHGYWRNLDTALATSDSAIVGGLIVESTPPGASVMMDGSGTGVTTPDTLTHFNLGLHELRFYLEGYNEHIEQIDYNGGYTTVHAVLTTPGWPRPVFFNLAPEDSAHFDDNVISIAGSVELEDSGGGRTPFDSDVVILRLNGADQMIPVYGGNFSSEVSIFSGDNALVYRATGVNGQTGVSDPLTIIGDFVPDDIVITLGWDSPTSDLDMHVWNPLGEHCYFGHQQISDGFLDIDDVDGYGPETFTATNAINGTYVVKINAYSMDSDPLSNASVAIWLNGGAPALYGPHEFTVGDHNGSNPAAWWEVAVFTMSGGAKSITVQPLSAERIAQMEVDMRNLPPKE